MFKVKYPLSVKSPEVAVDFHPTKNGNLSPDKIGYTSRMSVWWKCHKCGYEWYTPVKYRTKRKGRENGRGCPVCWGRVVSDMNRLSIVSPEVSKDLLPELNDGIVADDLTYSSNKCILWKCHKCAYQWKAYVNNRTHKTQPTGCPICLGIRV